MQKTFFYWLLVVSQVVATPTAGPEIRWDWSKIEPIQVQDLQFPQNFIFGVATSGHQVEGNGQCQWMQFEQQKDWRGRYKMEQSGLACDHWNRFKDDIQLIKNLGVSSYRFSLEWGKIEPRLGVFDQGAIDHYHELINELLAQNLTPMITLHHFTHPQWFEDKGAFEKEKNIKYFVRFCKKMFEEFGDKVHFWCTFNEPGVYAFQGYVHAKFPPAKKSVELAGIVSKNIILAHIDAYKAMKALPHGQDAQVGITHSITMFDPFHANGVIGRIESWLSDAINHVFYDAMLQFFVTGRFEYRGQKILGLLLAGNPTMMLVRPAFALIPMKTEFYSEVIFDYAQREGKPYIASDILDFFGIQPYSHALLDLTNPQAEYKPSLRDGELPTDMPYGIYPEIIERSVKAVAKIGVPMYITENGIADDKDDRRELYIRRYLHVVSQMIKQGYDIRGYFYWSLLDNFEWNLGYGKKFGLYAVDFKTQERILRKGGEYYKRVVEAHNARYAGAVVEA